ncbi:flagellar filament capping protein FliD [Herbaspirillum sp. YR522]|uniref:flagellar filament capping protein FliD n=1 Tax=Herbaspirillum sp. YR522 TaxID=1144342 RepID=UPI00026FA22A|nr:flagellar filament capping protein FliD [Herbaspirillum sp. YR522]EJN09774.1 flagellar capping protein [Herbaspirillum sp. YR522]
MATSSGSISSNAGPLNVADLVSKLMEVERKIKTAPLAKEAEGINAAISAYGSFKTALSTYQAALKGLNPATFSALKATVGNAGVGANLTTDAVSAEVNKDEQTKKLAQKLQSGGFPADQVFTSGSVMAIKVGTNPPAFITLRADSTLAGLRDTINASKAGVTASITTDAAGQRLVLESNTAGVANTIRITATGSLSSLAYEPSGGSASAVTQIQAPRDETKAAVGSYALTVSQLAQAHKLNSIGVTPGKTFDSGILAIKSGSGSTTMIKPTTNTLAGVRDAINASMAGVSASIVNDGSQDRLVLSSNNTGAANVLRITGTGDYAMFSFDPDAASSASGAPSETAMGQAVGAQDARITIDGIAVTSASNTIKNALSGIQLTVAKVTGAGDKVTLNITSDTSGMTAAANTFVTAYNALVKTVGELTKFTPSKTLGTKGTSAPLANDSTVRNMMAQLRGTLGAAVGAGPSAATLSRIGISMTKGATLELDSTKFTDATKKNFDAVEQLFGSTQGVVSKLQKILDQALGSDGLVDKKKEGLEVSRRIVEDRYDNAARRLDDLKDQLTNKYNRLNVALAKAEQRGNYLVSQLGQLSQLDKR